MIKEILTRLFNLGSELITDKDELIKHESEIKKLQEHNKSLALINNHEQKMTELGLKVLTEKNRDDNKIKAIFLDLQKKQMEKEQIIGEMQFTAELDTQQNELNALQLQSEDKFISRARPFATYILVGVFAILPFLILILILCDLKTDAIQIFIDYCQESIVVSVFGVLGLGTLRTYDKRLKK